MERNYVDLIFSGHTISAENRQLYKNQDFCSIFLAIRRRPKSGDQCGGFMQLTHGRSNKTILKLLPRLPPYLSNFFCKTFFCTKTTWQSQMTRDIFLNQPHWYLFVRVSCGHCKDDGRIAVEIVS